MRGGFPNRYEKAAPVAAESWYRLRLEMQDSAVRVSANGEPVLSVDDLRFPGRRGRLGLWVDDGSTGYFANLKVTAKP